MNKSKSPPYISHSKYKSNSNSKSIEQIVRAQLAPLLKISNPSSNDCTKMVRKKKSHHLLMKSTRLSSPNSCQSSELISKNQSRERLKVFRDKIPHLEHRMKKKNKIVLHKSNERAKINESFNKENLSKKSNVKIVSEQVEVEGKGQKADKKRRWKKNVLQRFVISSQYCQKCRRHQMTSLEQVLKVYLDDESSHSRSFLKYALSEGHNQSGLDSCLSGHTRILTIDWIYLISASLLLNRETVHLAVHYMDSYFSCCGEISDHIHTIAAACLYLSVKQQERDSQASLLETICLSEKFSFQKSQIIQMEHSILIKLNFKLKSNTLAFWIDYFTLKWDNFIVHRGSEIRNDIGMLSKIQLRDTDGQCYKLYREIMELGDCCLLFGEHIKFTQAKLALACIYLVLRVEIEREERANHQNARKARSENRRDTEPETPAEDLFRFYHRQFMKKASPIFKDPFRVNELYNAFLTDLCEFEITEIIPCIKYISHLLDLEFSYNIDNKAFDEAESYEDFIRRMTYSIVMKDYALGKNF